MNNGYLLPYENDFSIKDLNLDLMKYEQQDKYISLSSKNKQRALKKIEEINKNKEQRLQQIQESQLKMQEIKQQTPLYLRMENNYKQNILLPQYQQQQMKLASIKNFHRPIPLSNLQDHSKKAKSLLDMKIGQYIQKQPGQIKPLHVYESEAYRQIRNDFIERNSMNDKESEIEILQKKKKEYLEVQKRYMPQVDQKKKQELYDLQNKIFHKNQIQDRGFVYIKKNHKENQSYNEGDVYYAEQNKSIANPYINGINNLRYVHYIQKSPKPRQITEVSEDRKKDNITDWLKEQRQKHKFKDEDLYKQKIQKVLENSNLTQIQKQNEIQMIAEIYEEKKQRNKLLQKVKGKKINEEDNQQVLLSIKAKLQMLQD